MGKIDQNITFQKESLKKMVWYGHTRFVKVEFENDLGQITKIVLGPEFYDAVYNLPWQHLFKSTISQY